MGLDISPKFGFFIVVTEGVTPNTPQVGLPAYIIVGGEPKPQDYLNLANQLNSARGILCEQGCCPYCFTTLFCTTHEAPLQLF